MNEKIALAVTLLTIITLSTFCGGISVGEALDEDVRQNPKIEVLPESWNFGKIKDTEVKTHIFKVKNIGEKELVVKSVSTTCGCTIASISSNEIAPGKSAELKVTFDPKQTRASGKLKRDVYILSNDPETPTKIVSISADLKGKIKPEASKRSPPKISSSELYSRIQSGEKIVILDVREENEYVARHIPDAIWFPKSRFDKSHPDVLKKLKNIDKKTPIVTYCGAGHRSNYVAKKLIKIGYNAYNLDGISFWEKEGYPLIRGPELPPSEEPSIIYLEEAYENYYLLFKDVVWVDVRNIEDYKRGHIKGALGIPLSEIESRLNEIPQDKEIVFYCEGIWEGGSCEASRSAGRILIKNGFKQGKIKVFEDGFGAWKDAGYPVEPVKKKIDAQYIYSQFICECCGKTIDRCKCPMVHEKKTYINGLIDAEIPQKQILIKVAQKFGLHSLASKDKRAEIKAKIIKNVPSRRPEIVIKPEAFDFGKLSISKGVAKTSFTMKNKGKTALVIDNIKTSCGCTVVSLKTSKGKKILDFSMKGKLKPDWQFEMLPGEKAKLLVAFDPSYHPPNKFPFPVTRTITISSNDPVEPKKVIRIKAELIE